MQIHNTINSIFSVETHLTQPNKSHRKKQLIKTQNQTSLPSNLFSLIKLKPLPNETITSTESKNIIIKPKQRIIKSPTRHKSSKISFVFDKKLSPSFIDINNNNKDEIQKRINPPKRLHRKLSNNIIYTSPFYVKKHKKQKAKTNLFFPECKRIIDLKVNEFEIKGNSDINKFDISSIWKREDVLKIENLNCEEWFKEQNFINNIIINNVVKQHIEKEVNTINIYNTEKEVELNLGNNCGSHKQKVFCCF